MPPPPPAPNMSQALVSHDLMTVAAYADTLDALPLDLTRGFSDLRELDAVLSASLIHLTGAIKSLTSVLLNPHAEPGERLAILREVAEYAQRFKLGGEDKIRVVGGVCEGVISHQTHLSNLLSHSSLLTARPPSPPGSSSTVYLPPTTTGKRTRTGANASLTTPARKVQRRDAGAGGKGRAGTSANVAKGAANGEEWDDTQRSPQKGGAKKALARGRKVETSNRGASPAPSNLSQSFTASYHNPSPRPSNSRASSTLPSSVYPPSDLHGGQVSNEHLNLVDSVTPAGRGVGEKIDDLDHADSLANGGDGMDHGVKGKGKGRAGAVSSRRNLGVEDDDDEAGRGARGSGRGGRSTRGGTAVSGEGGEDSADDAGGSRRNASRRQTRLPAGGRDDGFAGSHPSQSDADYARMRHSEDEGSDDDGVGLSRGGTGRAEGAANTTGDSTGTALDDPETGDKKVYCYCNGVSYGEMIGCDDDDCPIEWFHLDCLDLTEPPEGSWLCPDCTSNRASKGRKGRK